MPTKPKSRRKLPPSIHKLWQTHYLWDAMPTQAGARRVAADSRKSYPECDAKARKLPRAQQAGSLRFGVYVKRNCGL